MQADNLELSVWSQAERSHRKLGYGAFSLRLSGIANALIVGFPASLAAVEACKRLKIGGQAFSL
jgi:hypothetical protein